MCQIGRTAIGSYLERYDPLGLRGATVTRTGENNHLIFKAEKDGRAVAIRMINPFSYRREEWMSMANEYDLLRALAPTGLAPQPYLLDVERFEVPLIFQEFVEATCFNALKPLSRIELTAAAEAIALLNQQPITPRSLPFLKNHVEDGIGAPRIAWLGRLADALRRKPRPSIAKWAFRILPVALAASRIIGKHAALFENRPGTFHFDGAHGGNVYLRGGKAMFLDWQKVSFRSDPSFTLARFAASMDTEKGAVSESDLDVLVKAYYAVHRVTRLREMVGIRLLERQVSDLVWVVWNYTRQKDGRPVEEATSVVQRYDHVRQLLTAY